MMVEEFGGDVNETRVGGGSPLHTATRFGATEIIEYLAAKGADFTAKDRFGRNPLEEAEFEAPKPTIELLRRLSAEAAARKKPL